MNKTWEGIKSFWHGVGDYPTLCLGVSLGLAYYLYEPILAALNTYFIGGDSIPLILLFDWIGTLLCFVISAILLYRQAYSWAWFPFAVTTVFVLPKLAVLHLGLVEDPLGYFLSAYIILAAVGPLTYFGWLISRAAVENREDVDNLNN